MHGCELGIAIFEKFENTVDPETEVYNPNVSFEVGYMMALKKPVLVLKDSRVSDLNSDLKSKIYNNFDKQQLQETIAPAIKKWVDKESLI